MAKWFACPICGKEFSYRALLMAHMKTHKKGK